MRESHKCNIAWRFCIRPALVALLVACLLVVSHGDRFRSAYVWRLVGDKIPHMVAYATRPDVVWVGLGAPKQEKWMQAHVGRVDAAAMIGVGAAFDFHCGEVRWAPAWIRKLGLEWAYRLVLEPKRMWRRNLDSPLFVAKVIMQRCGWRF